MSDDISVGKGLGNNSRRPIEQKLTGIAAELYARLNTSGVDVSTIRVYLDAAFNLGMNEGRKTGFEKGANFGAY